jgi:O-antigen/teichoic acid export membrane protein
MPLFRSTRTQAQVVFVVVTALAAGVSVVLLALALRYGALAEEVAIVPLLLTTWIGAAVYRRRFAGQRWWRRVGKAMATAGAIGGLAAVVALLPWTDWPDFGEMVGWALLITVGAFAWAACAVALLWLSDRRLAFGRRADRPRRRHSSRRSADG